MERKISDIDITKVLKIKLVEELLYDIERIPRWIAGDAHTFLKLYSIDKDKIFLKYVDEYVKRINPSEENSYLSTFNNYIQRSGINKIIPEFENWSAIYDTLKKKFDELEVSEENYNILGYIYKTLFVFDAIVLTLKYYIDFVRAYYGYSEETTAKIKNNILIDLKTSLKKIENEEENKNKGVYQRIVSAAIIDSYADIGKSNSPLFYTIIFFPVEYLERNWPVPIEESIKFLKDDKLEKEIEKLFSSNRKDYIKLACQSKIKSLYKERVMNYIKLIQRKYEKESLESGLI